MRALGKSLVALGLVLLVGGSAQSGVILSLLPPLPPLQVYKPDLVIREIKAHYDPLYQETVVELKIKNVGIKAMSAHVLMTGTVTYGTQSVPMQWAVDMALQPGESHTYYLGAIQARPSSMTVSAGVDTPVWPQLVGTVWESDEGNNTRSRTLALSADGITYDEQ